MNNHGGTDELQRTRQRVEDVVLQVPATLSAASLSEPASFDDVVPYRRSNPQLARSIPSLRGELMKGQRSGVFSAVKFYKAATAWRGHSRKKSAVVSLAHILPTSSGGKR